MVRKELEVIECPRCELEFDYYLPRSDPGRTGCPHCEGELVDRKRFVGRLQVLEWRCLTCYCLFDWCTRLLLKSSGCFADG